MKRSIILLALFLSTGCETRKIVLGPEFLNNVYKACNGIPFFVEVDTVSHKTTITCEDRSVYVYEAEFKGDDQQ